MSEELPKSVIKKTGAEEPFSAEKIKESIGFAVDQTEGFPDDLKTGMKE